MKNLFGKKILCTFALASVLMGAAPAYADTADPSAPVVTPPAATTPAVDPSVPVDPAAPVTAAPTGPATYQSLSAAMASYYANSKGSTLSQFVLQNPDQAAALLGTTPDALQALPVDDPKALDAAMKTQGLTLDTSGYADLKVAQADLSSKSMSLDAVIVASGANYAEQMASLRAPSLATPVSPGVDTSMASAMPSESLAFGLFLNKSLTDLVVNSPDVFSQIESTGLGTPEAQKAWNTSMMNAMSASKGDLTSMLPSQCGGVFLSAMASGSAADAAKSMPSGKDCGSCLVSGIYSHGQMSLLFNPSMGDVNPKRGEGAVDPYEYDAMMPFQKQALQGQNSNLSSALDTALGLSDAPITGSCEGSSASVKKTANTSMTKTLAFLNK